MDAGNAPCKPGHAALRKGRISLPGHVYLVTFACRQRRPLFQDGDLAATAAQAIADPRLWQDAMLLAWVLMPDHWHGLIRMGHAGSLSRTVARLKCNTRQLHLRHGNDGGIWAPAFHDRALRQEEDLVGAARYLILNPVRAGLVTRVGDYPYWDACWLDPKNNPEPL